MAMCSTDKPSFTMRNSYFFTLGLGYALHFENFLWGLTLNFEKVGVLAVRREESYQNVGGTSNQAGIRIMCNTHIKYTLQITYYTLHITHYTLQINNCTFVTLYILITYTLHIKHYTLHNTLPTHIKHYTLRSARYTLRITRLRVTRYTSNVTSYT